MSAGPPRDNLRGGAWLIADIGLNVWALSIVKALGADYPAAQIVFLRAATGLVLIAPLIWRQRAAFAGLADPWLHLLRVGLSAMTLTASFFAISRVPLALFTAMNFTRPLVVMVLAALVLGEAIGRRRWIAAGIALAGVAVAVGPVPSGSLPGLSALALVVLSGSAAVIVTRRLRAAPEIVLMTFYTAGLAALAAPVAAAAWSPVAPAHWLPLVAVGLFAQSAQVCFLRAHFFGEAGVLSVLSYLSLVVSVTVGWAVFGEVPGRPFWIGAALVLGAALWGTAGARPPRMPAR
ncbi:DMT family transporter [Rhodobacteraceae bacterium CCMM004]|nr:DMT family transporter [Rhodobacteraceae bacterium CCMM004]